MQQQEPAPGRQGSQRAASTQPLLVEVVVRQPQRDCPVYTWDREHACLVLSCLHRAEPGLPADLAVLLLEGKAEVPLLLLTSLSSPPGTRVQARVLGALRYQLAQTQQQAPAENVLPLDGWVLVGAPEIETDLDTYRSIEALPSDQLVRLKRYVQTQTAHESEVAPRVGEVLVCGAQEAAQYLRASRLWLRQTERRQRQGKSWLAQQEEVHALSWRTLQGLSPAMRAQLLTASPTEADAIYAQAERLIRFVPARFQQALAALLLSDEHVLAFVERPLLRHRSGWLGLQTWRSNAGIVLVTDRQVLWLRDFHSPGSSLLSGGYIAHSAPLERLYSIFLLSAGRVPETLAARLETRESPYLRLVLEVESATGRELVAIEFPSEPEAKQALEGIVALLEAFLPCPQGQADRRVRRVPQIEVWQPQGAEAERLQGLGGMLPADVSQRLEQCLVTLIEADQDECLVKVQVPAIEDYHSPARLIALTRQAVLVLAERGRQSSQGQRYALADIASAQMRYALAGSSLSLFIPQGEQVAQQIVIPFHSPAIAWFVPLFTRLRVALSSPYRTR